MKIIEVAEKLGYEAVAMPCPDKEVTGGYTGDLLSWVMVRAREGNIWITIMTNSNIVAVASLSGVSAIVIAEGLPVSQDIVELADEKNVNILKSKKSVFETSIELGNAIGIFS